MDYGKSSIFALLDNIRARPAMYLRGYSLRDLETLIWGYYAALREHGIVEDVPQMTRHFLFWLHRRTGWSTNCGWDDAIEARYPDTGRSFAAFFEFVDEYRKLIPIVVCTARLIEIHQPTGNRVRYGFEGKMKKPDRVDIVRYHPEPLHFLRFHYGDRIVDDDLLMNGDGSFDTEVSYAKQWVKDELQVDEDAWVAATDLKTGG